MAKLIPCFSYVHGHKEAQEIVTDLNQMKSPQSEEFFIQYNKNQDYSQDDRYLILGDVSESDWDNLNLESDFLEI
jgi:hypothetical protein